MVATKQNAGFTLVEVVIAILTLAVIVIGTAALLSQSGMSIWRNAHSGTAIEVANDLLENALRADYGTITDSSTNVFRSGITYTVLTDETEYASPVTYKDVVVSVTQNGETISARTYVIKGFGIQN